MASSFPIRASSKSAPSRLAPTNVVPVMTAFTSLAFDRLAPEKSARSTTPLVRSTPDCEMKEASGERTLAHWWHLCGYDSSRPLPAHHVGLDGIHLGEHRLDHVGAREVALGHERARECLALQVRPPEVAQAEVHDRVGHGVGLADRVPHERALAAVRVARDGRQANLQARRASGGSVRASKDQDQGPPGQRGGRFVTSALATGVTKRCTAATPAAMAGAIEGTARGPARVGTLYPVDAAAGANAFADACALQIGRIEKSVWVTSLRHQSRPRRAGRVVDMHPLHDAFLSHRRHKRGHVSTCDQSAKRWQGQDHLRRVLSSRHAGACRPQDQRSGICSTATAAPPGPRQRCVRATPWLLSPWWGPRCADPVVARLSICIRATLQPAHTAVGLQDFNSSCAAMLQAAVQAVGSQT